MAEKISYFDLAENDYHSLIKSYEAGVEGNFICSNAQKICERYLKQILDKYGQGDELFVMRSHSLKTLKNELKKKVPDFTCDWNTVMNADGYYFTNTYPGDDTFFSDSDDTRACVEATIATRTAVIEYEKMQEQDKKNEPCDITQDEAVKDMIDGIVEERKERSDTPVFDSLCAAVEKKETPGSRACVNLNEER